MFRPLGFLLIAALALATPASAEVRGDWGYYAATASRFRVPLPDAYVHRSDCPAYATGGPCASWESGEIWLPDRSRGRFALAHELGHRFDAQFLSDADREWLRRVMRAPGGDWLEPGGAAEWFADYYADCAVGLGRHSEESRADRPSRGRLARVCLAVWVRSLTSS